MDDAEKIRRLLRQQAAVAGFGSFALRQTDMPKILTEAARACAHGLGVPYAKVCRYRQAENDLLIEAGYGWKEGVVGTIESTDMTSPQGRAFVTGEPSIFNDLRGAHDFALPSFYAEYGILSIVDVVIHVKGDETPYGVLEIDNDVQHDYDQHDIDFLTGFANVLAEAVATAVRTVHLQIAVEKMRALTEAQERLLEQKIVLAEELQHRVRNNLQLVYGMLSKQLADTTDEDGRRGLRAISRRVSTLSQVYNHLLGTEMGRTTDFGRYVKSLCADLAEIRATPDQGIELTCDSEALILDLDVVTALGIIVAELVTNSYDHAFAGGVGATNVSVRYDAGDGGTATMTISDNGKGFKVAAGSKRHGLGLVRRLVEQVRGTATLNSDHGTVWSISFPTTAAAV